MDAARRTALMHEAFRRVRDNVYTIPLHRQVIPWAARAGVHVVHRADNVLEGRGCASTDISMLGWPCGRKTTKCRGHRRLRVGVRERMRP
jgi:hypothetical protein